MMVKTIAAVIVAALLAAPAAIAEDSKPEWTSVYKETTVTTVKASVTDAAHAMVGTPLKPGTTSHLEHTFPEFF